MTDVIVTTLNLAAIYGLVAVGISITWAGLRFLNLAQGTTFAVAGYGAWFVSKHISSSSPVVIAAGMLTGALCGVIICVAVFLPLYGDTDLYARMAIQPAGNIEFTSAATYAFPDRPLFLHDTSATTLSA